MHYVVVVEETHTGYSAYVPDLPGCISVGDSQDELEKNIHEAILFHIEGMKEDGIAIPKPTTMALTLRDWLLWNGRSRNWARQLRSPRTNTSPDAVIKRRPTVG